EVVTGEPEAEIDRDRQVEPARRAIRERAIELVEPAPELRRLEVGGRELLAQRLQRAPRIRRGSGRGRDVPLEVIDDQPEPIAQPAYRIGELARDLDRHLTAEVLRLRGHRDPVSRNQVSLSPPSISPRA